MCDVRVRLLATVLVAGLVLVHPATALEIPRDVKDIVTFLFVRDAHGHLVPQGTGFFVGVRGPGPVQSSKEYLYLVTAGHVVRDPGGRLLPSIWVRMNRKGKDAEMLQLDLAALSKDRVLEPRDSSVDLVAILWAPDGGTYDYRHIHAEMLGDRDVTGKLHVAEGSEAFFTGLFTSYFGQKRNVPIVRFGRIALLPTEKIPIGARPDGSEDVRELYLLETQAFAGNSGSPVFFYMASGVNGAGTTIRLGGVLVCTFMNFQRVQVGGSRPERTAVSRSTLGIAGIIPSHLLLDLLTGEDSRNQRANLTVPAVGQPDR